MPGIDNERKSFVFFFYKRRIIRIYNILSRLNSLIRMMGMEYISKDWRIFIDSSNKSLKAVLLYNGNTIGSIPLAYSQKLKENYENMELLLKLIKYNQHKWKIYGDLKIISILLGQQAGYTKYPCFFMFVG